MSLRKSLPDFNVKNLGVLAAGPGRDGVAMRTFRSCKVFKNIGDNTPSGSFKDFLCSPLLGKIIQFDEHMIQMDWFNHQLE